MLDSLIALQKCSKKLCCKAPGAQGEKAEHTMAPKTKNSSKRQKTAFSTTELVLVINSISLSVSFLGLVLAQKYPLVTVALAQPDGGNWYREWMHGWTEIVTQLKSFSPLLNMQLNIKNTCTATTTEGHQ